MIVSKIEVLLLLLLIYFYCFFEGVFFKFGQANYSLLENNGSVVLTVNMEGTTHIPLTVSIETFDITAYGDFTLLLGAKL